MPIELLRRNHDSVRHALKYARRYSKYNHFIPYTHVKPDNAPQLLQNCISTPMRRIGGLLLDFTGAEDCSAISSFNDSDCNETIFQHDARLLLQCYCPAGE